MVPLMQTANRPFPDRSGFQPPFLPQPGDSKPKESARSTPGWPPPQQALRLVIPLLCLPHVPSRLYLGKQHPRPPLGGQPVRPGSEQLPTLSIVLPQTELDPPDPSLAGSSQASRSLQGWAQGLHPSVFLPTAERVQSLGVGGK